MDIGILGINYRASEISLRESFAKAAQCFLERTLSLPFILLSTCNRTEIYFSGNDLSEMHSKILLELKEDLDFGQRLYSYFGRHCFNHLAKVTSGTDSILFGEAEIQRQVKQAYEQAAFTRDLPASMHYLFQKCLKIGKEIRTEFSLPKGHVSLESTIWDLSLCFFTQIRPISLLFIGYSEINRKILPFFKNKGGFDLFLATKRRDSVKEFIDKYGVMILPWDRIEQWAKFDMIICASKSSEYILKVGQIPKDPLQAKARLIIDLGLPRNVDPLISKSPSIALFNIEELGGFIEQKQEISMKEQMIIQKNLEEAVARQVAIYARKRKSAFVCA